MTAAPWTERWVEAIAEHSTHQHWTGAEKGITTQAIADCPDIAPLLP